MALVYMSGTCRAGKNTTHFPKSPGLPPKPLLSLPIFPSSAATRPAAHVVFARKGLSSRTRRLEKEKKGSVTTGPEEDGGGSGPGDEDGLAVTWELSSTPMPSLPGLEKNFWEGPQFDVFGFVVQYLWAFGVGFALIACGIAVATYNEGATDFKDTPVYKEAIQSQELLEEPDASSSDVFEGNPTEDAPSLE